eukprot:NODE_3049_length_988_cov_12.658147_g2547_i0.p1 GENE.NODE_3049_length_988_cov_12.658147_g2547_i0~~NODE_3049_length_988_cov_12.658147_g2547_i0.p1  ORF type:complete len:228 (-),score=42.81 NODE_3049_length_988_cov_12.658147_g2547_i0:87-770(-)
MVRLTADLIRRRPHFTNPLKYREIDLRGLGIEALENLGVLNDGFDVVDLSDNEIVSLDNFPELRRLKILILHNNRLVRIDSSCEKTLSSVHTLVAHNSHFRTPEDLKGLQYLPNLHCLSLLGSPICRHQHYRMLCIALLPNLTRLDFQKIHPSERKQAKKLFPSLISKEKPEAGASAVSIEAEAAAERDLAIDEKAKEELEAAIEAADSLEELQRLESQLAQLKSSR